MTETAPARPVTYRRVAGIALPVVLSNATVPLQGAVDTAIIGNLGQAHALAAVTLGATVVTLLFSSFNFLWMGVSGLTAQAVGAQNAERVMNTLARALLIAMAAAALLVLVSGWIAPLSLALFEGSPAAEAEAHGYVLIRLWSAPAELANLAIMGWFVGQQQTRRLFELQLVISVLNIALNLLFVLGLGWGVEGVALGTAVAATAGTGLGLWRIRQRARVVVPTGYRLDWPRILQRREIGPLLALNTDIFIRTLCLTGSFTWIARLGSLEGDAVLAANGVLLQFLHISAHALDGFAIAAETLVGQALGARDSAQMRRSVVVSTVAALGLATVFSLVASALAGPVIALFTNVPEVQEIAIAHALWATALPLVAVLAYQLDGVFLGAADGPAMRNAMLVSTALFLPLSWALTQSLGNHGLWASLWVFMALRTLTLALRYPGLERRANGRLSHD
ncbi:MAG: MATE family efflux transporter [Pseudomonadota bacterium]